MSSLKAGANSALDAGASGPTHMSPGTIFAKHIAGQAWLDVHMLIDACVAGREGLD
jgi:hypothetical protein